jgi:drug/metabolite transporter (DMT)-like permease
MYNQACFVPFASENLMSLQAIPYILMLGFLFGSTLVASRFSVDQFDALTFVGIRLALAGGAFLLVYVFKRRRIPRDRLLWKRAAVLGVFGTAVPMSFIVSSLQFLSSGVASIMITSNPALTVLFAHFALDDERLNGHKILGVGLALGGAILLALRGESGLPNVDQAEPLGYILMFSAMISSAGVLVYARKHMKDLPTFEVASVRLWTAACLIIPIALLFVGFDLSRVNLQGFEALIYASIAGTFFAMMLEFYNVKHFGATAAVMSAYIIPVFASLGGAIFLGEKITFGMLAGMGLIGTGLYFIQSS